MFYNNKGSILATTLIIFSILVTISMSCIALYYSNSSIFNLEYKEANMREIGYGAIEICNSNIIKEVEFALENKASFNEFNNYLLDNNFLTNIKDISKSELNNVLISIPNKIQKDKNGEFLNFDIVSSVKENKYIKKYKASVKIKNIFYNKVEDNDTTKDEENKIDYEEESNQDYQYEEKNIFNINEIVMVYNYKEI